MPLVTSFGGSEIEFGGNGSKMTKANSRFVFLFLAKVFSVRSVMSFAFFLIVIAEN